MKKTLNIDVETYSETDLKNHGAYRYVEDKSFSVLIIAYSIDGSTVRTIDTTKIKSSSEVYRFANMLTSDQYKKVAWNANFELQALSTHFRVELDPNQWECTMVNAMRAGLPASLDKCGEVLNISKLKDKRGKDLIKYFSVPCRPTKANLGRTRNLPEHDPVRWQQYIDYCRRDVEAEMEIANKINDFPVLELEQKLWALDQVINRDGLKLDIDLVNGAVALDKKSKAEDLERAKRLTGLENPNSRNQLLEWFNEHGAEIDDVQKATVEALLKHENEKVRALASMRLNMSKTSISKYTKMRDMACRDDRVKGLLQFYGASRTGRWAGRGVQLQNLTKHRMKDAMVDIARDLIRDQDFETLDLIFKESPQDILSQLVRTAFISDDGKSLYVSDFSAIEARVIAWFAKENWRLDVFRSHGKIYEASASAMFNVPLKEITRDSPLRQQGKVAELALGYQGSVGALKSMGAEDMGLSEDEMKALVVKWRDANQNIVNFWYGLQSACVTCIETREPQEVYKLKIYMFKGFLLIQLPSGRTLSYPKPVIRQNRWGGDVIVFKGLNERNQWGDVDTYGGKLVENVVQATARDILATAILRLNDKGFKIVGHVHDEVIIEAADTTDISEIDAVMSEPIDWAPELPLGADGFVSKYYKKD